MHNLNRSEKLHLRLADILGIILITALITIAAPHVNNALIKMDVEQCKAEFKHHNPPQWCFLLRDEYPNKFNSEVK